MASSQIFVYPSLTNPATQIRLLQVLPANDDVTSVSVTLEPFQRSPDRIYDALSYTWGDASKTIPIAVNGCQFRVTENLHRALVQLRDFKDTQEYVRNRYVWIDALCINQNDDSEKSVQVQMMKEIFADAAQVIIWLGTPSEDYYQGLEAISTLAAIYVDYRKATEQDQHNPELKFDELVSRVRNFVAQLTENELSSWGSITKIFKMPWWRRVWIIQEVVVARRAWVILGDGMLNFEAFRYVQKIAHEMGKIDDEKATIGCSFYSIRDSTNRVEGVLKKWLHDKPGPLEALLKLYLYGSSQSTEPHDKLYALMGLGIEVEGLVGKVDYSQPWQEVYTKLARVLLENHGPSILSLCVSSAERAESKLPSWVPDWTRYIPPPFYNWGYASAYSMRGKRCQTINQQHQGQELILLGNQVAGICEVESPYFVDQTRHDRVPSVAAIQDWHESVARLASTLKLSAEQKEDMVMRTVVGDRYFNPGVADFRRLTTSDKLGYKAFVKFIDLPIRKNSENGAQYTQVFTDSDEYLCAAWEAAHNRRPFKADGGQLGVGSSLTDVGDIICIFQGATVPFVLRPTSDGRWKFLGEAYVDGIMDGQFMETAGPAETFVLF